MVEGLLDRVQKATGILPVGSLSMLAATVEPEVDQVLV
jgi:hypothetical protein